MKQISSITLLLMFLPAVIHAQRRSDVCRVTSSTWSRPDKIGTGIYEVGRFSVSEIEEQTIKSFRFNLYDSNFVVNVGVEYGDAPAVEKGKPTDIHIALVVSGKEQDPFDFLENADTAIAGTSYGRRWGSLYVRKEIVSGQSVHTFTLTCNDGSKTTAK
jgi:hypothetical protein